MVTTKQVRNAIRSAARAQSAELLSNTYTDGANKRIGLKRYVCFPMLSATQARKVAQEANFILFAQTGETNVVRVVQSQRINFYQTGRPYLRATATLV
jgi:hypothetical protein